MPRSDFRSFIAENYPSLPPPTNNGSKGPVPELSAPPLLPPLPVPPSGDSLPVFLRASDIVAANIVIPELIVEGLLHRGCKLILSGGSKAFKSWALMHLGLSLTNGIPWWGLRTKKNTVIYLNFELIGGFFEQRILAMCRAIGHPPPDNFIYWNLRGFCYDLSLLAKVLVTRLHQTGPVGLIIVDPVYKALGDLDENSASDMTKLMNLVESIATQMGAAVAFGSHYAKGNAAGKEVKDRAAGSGVLSRDPDVILAMTRHKVEDAYAIESELRYLPRLSPFVVRWNFPIMQPDESLDPRELYVPGEREDASNTKQGGPGTLTEIEILECLPDGGAQDTLWRKMVSLRFGRSGQEFYTAKANLIKIGSVIKAGLKFYKANMQLKPQ